VIADLFASFPGGGNLASMALARTNPARKIKAKPIPRIPREWPEPGTESFRRLPEEEQAWLLSADAWYLKARILGAPSSMLHDPTFEPLLKDPDHHIPYLVKYWRVSPSIFSFALRTLTGYRPEQATVAATHRAWKTWLKSHQKSLSHAAE
jgi:hypothetical protein